jgi:hypothetical protein
MVTDSRWTPSQLNNKPLFFGYGSGPWRSGRISRRTIVSLVAVKALVVMWFAPRPWSLIAALVVALAVVYILTNDWSAEARSSIARDVVQAGVEEECPCLDGDPDRCTVHNSDEYRAARSRDLRRRVEEETAAEHIRNALQILASPALIFHRDPSAGRPTQYCYDLPDLDRVVSRLLRALDQLSESPVDPPLNKGPQNPLGRTRPKEGHLPLRRAGSQILRESVRGEFALASLA